MSEQDSWPEPHNEAPEPQKKKSTSSCLLISMIVGGVGLVCSLVCCGVGAWFFSMFYPTITTEPAAVTAVGRQIFDTEMIEDFSPSNAFTIDNTWVTARLAQFKHKEGKGELLLASAQLKFGDPNAMNAEQTRQFRGNSEEQIRGNLDLKKVETHEITVFGKKVNITVNEGVDREHHDNAVHIATCEFVHNKTQYFFLIRMDDDAWDQEAVFKMLEEAKTPAP